jgi:hypothetical protein
LGIASRETDYPFPSNPAIFTPIDVNRDKVPVAPPSIHRAIPPPPPTTGFNFTFKWYWTQLDHAVILSFAFTHSDRMIYNIFLDNGIVISR